MRLSLLTLFAISIVTTTVLIDFHFSPAQEQSKDKDEKQPPEKKAGPKIDKLDEEILARGKLTADAAGLLDFFKKRTLSEQERPELEKTVRRLGSSVFIVRERARLALVERGVASLDVLRDSLSSSDLETKRRIEATLLTIQEADVPVAVPAAAVRVLALLKPAGMIEILLGYLPFADNDAVVDEIRIALTTHAVKDGKADPALVAALKDRAPLRRAIAGEALGRAAFAEHKDALRKLLIDPDANVRFRVARMLAFAKLKDAVPILIDTIPDLPINAAWQAEDFLLNLAAAHAPPSAPMGTDKETRVKCKDAWQAWWQKHEAKIDLAKLEETPKLLGRTLIVLLDQSSVAELSPDNTMRWEIKNLVFPLDAQIIDEERVLIAEHHANRVSERNHKGEILWQKAVVNPLAAQRLPNGNTFVATPFALLEYDKDGGEVLNVTLSENAQFIMKAMKLPNGEIVCLTADSHVVRYSALGKELSSFEVSLAMRLFGGRIEVLPSGRVLVPHNAEGKVIEYDHKGKIVWEIPFEQPIAATRLPNGNTVITSMNPQIGAVEVDRAGTQVWSYQHESNTRVTRAIRR